MDTIKNERDALRVMRAMESCRVVLRDCERQPNAPGVDVARRVVSEAIASMKVELARWRGSAAAA